MSFNVDEPDCLVSHAAQVEQSGEILDERGIFDGLACAVDPGVILPFREPFIDACRDE